jgi:hypothetical protein
VLFGTGGAFFLRLARQILVTAVSDSLRTERLASSRTSTQQQMSCLLRGVGAFIRLLVSGREAGGDDGEPDDAGADRECGEAVRGAGGEVGDCAETPG